MEFIQAALYTDFLGTPLFFWWAFAAIVIGLLVFDLGILHKGNKEIEARESFILYGGYMVIAFAFGAWVWWAKGSQSGLEFFTGYLIEQSLSMDNIFVMATIFAFLGIPRMYQHRVLFWGIIGVVVFRAILIGVGAALVLSFSWILYLFGAFLVFTGVRMFTMRS
jgi:tellurite resistance protein TerC